MPLYPGKNPLARLQGGSGLDTRNYDFSYLTYPLEFDDKLSFGHYMNFYINVQTGSDYLSGEFFGNKLYNTNPEHLSNFGNNSTAATGKENPTWSKTFRPAFGSKFASSYVLSPGETLGGIPSEPGGQNFSIADFFSSIKDNLLGGSPSKASQAMFQTRISQAISLYIPDSMSFTTSYDWQDASLTEMGGKYLKGGQDVGGVLSAVLDKVRDNGSEAAKTIGQAASDIILNPTGGDTFGDKVLGMAGMAVNPQIFVLFRGIDLRRFQFDFIFTPKSPEEAANVRNIIKAFRFHAAPEIRSDFARYYIAPSTFNIEFMYKDKINRNIFQMTTCVLNRLSVDYAPYGWATFNDGMPVQTVLSMTFQETEIITKAKVNEGY